MNLLNPRPIACSAILICSIAVGSTWTPTSGPEGGRVTSIVHGGAQFYAAVGGVHRSGDGATWTRTSDGLPFGAIVDSIAANGDVVVAAIGAAVHVSADGGATWTLADTGLPETGTVEVHAFDGAFLLLHAEFTGAQRLRAGGVDGWEERTLPGSSGSRILVDGPRLFATVDSGNLFRSDDAAGKWVPIGDELPFDLFTLLARTDAAVVIYGLITDALFRSTDDGATWTQVAADLGNDLFVGIGVASGATIIVGGGTTPGLTLFRSLDDGATWAPLDGAGLPPFFTTLRAAAADENTLVLGFDAGAWRSDDAGNSWQPANRGIVASTVSRLGAAGATILAAAPFGPPNLRSEDGGATWTEMTPALPAVRLTAFHADDALDIIAGSHDDGAYRTLDGGVTWDLARSGLPTYNSTSGPRHQPLNGFTAIDDALFVATGGGRHFVTGDQHCGCRSVPSGDGVYRTTNRGASWQRVSNGLPVNIVYLGEPILHPILDVLAADEAVLAATEEHGVYRTTNFGASWSPVSGTPGGLAFASIDGAHYLLGADARIFRSDDAGLTWEDVGADLLPDAFGTMVAHDGALHVSGTGLQPTAPGVYRSEDGITWSPLDAGLGATAVVSLTVADGTLVAGTVARGVWVLEPFDLDGDGVVGFGDLLIVLAAWGDCPLPPADCPADLDNDGIVGFADLLLILTNWS